MVLTTTTGQHQQLPERENDETGDDEDGGESNEDVVAGVPPSSVVEHLCRLWRREREMSLQNQRGCKSVSLQQVEVFGYK